MVYGKSDITVYRPVAIFESSYSLKDNTMKEHHFNISRLAFLLFWFMLSGSMTYAQKQPTTALKAELTANALKGWNNWENQHLYTWIDMPEGLALKLLFRNRANEWPYWLTETYVGNKEKKTKYTYGMDVTPLAHSYDGSYTESILEWKGMKANISSAAHGDNIYILFRPLENPAKSHCMIMNVGMMYNKAGKVFSAGNKIVAEMPDKTLEIKATKQNEDIGFNVMGPGLFFFSDTEVAFYTGEDKTHEEVVEIMNQSRKQYFDHCNQYGELSEAYNAMKNVVAHNLIYDPVNQRPVISVSRSWNESWGGYILFDWDTYFASVMAAFDNKEIAFANAIAMTDEITKHGFIPNVAAIWDQTTEDRSQPPVGSMCVRLIYEKYPEKQFLSAVYDNLLTWNRWWEKERTIKGYITWGSNKVEGSGLNNQHNKKAAMFESGLDNSPLFDSIDFNEETNTLNLGSVGLLSLYVYDCQALAFIARELGKTEDAKELDARAKRFGMKIHDHWDEKSGIYRDIYPQTGQFSTHLAPTSFYPMLTGIPTKKQVDRMIKEHYYNEKEFYGEWILPSISRDNPAFGDNVYWRGRIWAPMNFLVYMGLRNYDLPAVRKDLADKSVKLILNDWNKYNLVFENYNSVTGQGGDVDRTNPYYSWGGLLSLIALMEYGYWD